MKNQAQKVLETFLWEPKFSKRDEKSALIRALKQVINELQRGTTLGAVIMCEDVLELCEELEAQDKKEAEEEYEYFHISYRKDAPF
jgi:hypothetical protein